jgi:hypothetical protein
MTWNFASLKIGKRILPAVWMGLKVSLRDPGANRLRPFVILILLFWWVIAGGRMVFADDGKSSAEQTGEPNGVNSEVSLESFDFDKALEKVEIRQPISKYRLFGSLREDVAYGLSSPAEGFGYDRESPGLVSVRTKLELGLDYRFSDDVKARISGFGRYDGIFDIEGHSDFTDEYIRDRQWETELTETYLDMKFPHNFGLKIGRQIIAWGESNLGQVTDIANPRDNRDLGLLNLEDARLPVFAVLGTVFSEHWEVDVGSIHEMRPTQLAVKGSEFDQYARFRSSGIEIADDDIPQTGLKNPEWISRLSFRGRGGDIAFVYGDVFSDTPYLEMDADDDVLVPKFDRMQVYGLSGTRVFGSLLLRAEFAWQSGVKVMAKDESDNLHTVEKELGVGALGAEYSGFKDLMITTELLATRTSDYTSDLLVDNVSYSSLVDVQYSMLREKLTAFVRWVRFFDGNGDFLRADLTYNYNDFLTYRIGVAFYSDSDEDGSLYPYRGNDQVNFGIQWTF